MSCILRVEGVFICVSVKIQGVIVLSRQWKNILYTPLLLEHNFKSKHMLRKPLNVTFAVPDPEEVMGYIIEFLV